jgi:hypothetical protein
MVMNSNTQDAVRLEPPAPLEPRHTVHGQPGVIVFRAKGLDLEAGQLYRLALQLILVATLLQHQPKLTVMNLNTLHAVQPHVLLALKHTVHGQPGVIVFRAKGLDLELGRPRKLVPQPAVLLLQNK